MNLTCSIEFSAAHLYEKKEWSPEKNKDQFGLCYTPYGHGHNYLLEVSFDIGSFVKKSSSNFTLISGLNSNYQDILKEITQEFEHHHMNFDIPEFKNKVPTTENISLYLLNKLRKYPQTQVKQLRLKEMNSLWVEIQV